MDRNGGARRRLVLFSRDCAFSDRVLQRLAASGTVEVAGIVKSVRPLREARGPVDTLAAFLRRTGPSYTGYLVRTSVFVPGLSRWRPLSAWSRRLGAPLVGTGDVNAGPVAAFVDRIAPDILLAAEFDQILRPPFLSEPDRLAVNIHPSLLPAHRGIEPVLHGRLAGDTRFGVTVHLLAEKVDRGAVLARRVVPIDGLPLAESYLALFEAGAAAFLEAVAGKARPAPQEAGGGTNTYPAPAAVAAYRAAGHRL